MKKLVSCVDSFSELSGRWVSLLILPLVFVVMYEVVMRKVFHAPTSWAFEMTIYLYGAHFMLGMAYTMYHDRHVCIDVIVQQLPERIQLWLRVITFLIYLCLFSESSRMRPWAMPQNHGCIGSTVGVPGSLLSTSTRPSCLWASSCSLFKELPLLSAIFTSSRGRRYEP